MPGHDSDAMKNEIRDWLKALGALVAGSISVDEAQKRLSVMVPMLASDFSVSAFTPASLSYVARGCRFFPTYCELCERLSAFALENRASVPRLEDKDRDGLDEHDRGWLGYYARRLPEYEAEEARMGERRLSTIDPAQHPVARLGSLVRNQSPKAWAVIERKHKAEVKGRLI